MGNIYKYSFGDEARSAYQYLYQFLRLLIRDQSNDRTLDFFSSVVDKSGDYEDRYEIYAYIGASENPSVVFELQKSATATTFEGVPAIFFNGTDMVPKRISLLTSENEPIGWPIPTERVGYYDDVTYCSYDENTGEYTPVDDETVYEPNVYYSIKNGAWYTELGYGGSVLGFDIDDRDIPKTGYLTSKGALIISRRGRATIIAKTAAGKVAIITPDFNSGELAGTTASFCTGYAVMGDGDTIAPDLASPLSFHEAVSCTVPEHPIAEQTTLCPITTHRTDVASNVVGAFCMPASQHREEGVLEINGTRYATNGYFALAE